MTKVLILDQSKSMRNTLRERLEFEGFATEAVDNEILAAQMCRKIPFDVIVSDSSMHIPDAGIPFIILSAENDIDSAVRALRSGAHDFLTKPIDMNRLLQAIRSTAEAPRSENRAKSAPRTRRRTASASEMASPMRSLVRYISRWAPLCTTRTMRIYPPPPRRDSIIYP